MSAIKTALIAGLCLASAGSLSAALEVLSVTGSGKAGDQTLDSSIKEPLKIEEDTQIETGPDSRILIRTQDGTVLALGASTLLELSRGSDGVFDGRIISGTVVTRSSGVAPYRIATHGGTLQVNEGTFAIQRMGEASVGYVSEGSVQTPTGHTISGGKWIAVDAGGVHENPSALQLAIVSGRRGAEFHAFMDQGNDLANNVLVLLGEGVQSGAIPYSALNQCYSSVVGQSGVSLNKLTLQILDQLGIGHHLPGADGLPRTPGDGSPKGIIKKPDSAGTISAS